MKTQCGVVANMDDRWRGVPSAAVSVKALRFAPMNAQRTRGLD